MQTGNRTTDNIRVVTVQGDTQLIAFNHAFKNLIVNKHAYK